jgi:cell division protein FtsB
MLKALKRLNLQILNPLRWRKQFLFTVLAAFLVVWFVFLDTYSLTTRVRLSREKSDLIRKTEQLRTETEELEKKIANLRNDSALLEKIAREEYGMKKPNETVYRIKTD